MSTENTPFAPQYRRPAIAFCSFCMKSETEVAQMIAAPANIFICDECVAMCGEYFAGRKPDRSAYVPMERLPAERLITYLKPVDDSLCGKSTQLHWIVAKLKSSLVSWDAIGEALGVSPQSAMDRFG